MIQSYTDYRTFLREVLVKRKLTNRGYSLRAFARDLNLSPARLSEVLSGKKGLSVDAAKGISKSMRLDGNGTVRFCDMVEATHARSKAARELAGLRLEIQRRKDSYQVRKPDLSEVFSTWYCVALMELTQIRGFRNDPKWIAQTLGIASLEAQQAIEKLKAAGLLVEEEGILIKPHRSITTPTDVPSRALRSLCKQVLELADQALSEQPIEMRDFGTITMAIDKSKIPQAKKMISEFRRKLCEFLESGEQTEVYCMATQLFKMSK